MIPNFKEIIDLVKKGATIEAQEKIMELREATIKLQQENSELLEKVKVLEKIIDKKLSMKFESPFYYANGDNVPHCPRCWEVNHKAIHYPAPFNNVDGPNYTCPQCKTVITHPQRQRQRQTTY